MILCQPGGWLLARTKAETLLNGVAMGFVGYDKQSDKTAGMDDS
jgi:hypothetical protein